MSLFYLPMISSRSLSLSFTKFDISTRNSSLTFPSTRTFSPFKFPPTALFTCDLAVGIAEPGADVGFWVTRIKFEQFSWDLPSANFRSLFCFFELITYCSMKYLSSLIYSYCSLHLSASRVNPKALTCLFFFFFTLGIQMKCLLLEPGQLGLKMADSLVLPHLILLITRLLPQEQEFLLDLKHVALEQSNRKRGYSVS